MPQLHYPRTPDGLVVPVVVALDNDSIIALHAAGLSIPAPIHALGLIDTGADLSGVSSRLLPRAPFRSLGQANTSTAAGASSPRLFAISMSIVPPTGSMAPLFTHPVLMITEIPHPTPQIDVLIGLDVLDTCTLLNDGPRGQFSIFF
jgi:hypothetical protein